MSDILAGPTYFGDVLRLHHDEDAADIGEQPKSYMEVASEKLANARKEARKMANKSAGKVIKVITTVQIIDYVSIGNADAARLEPEFFIDVTMPKATKKKGRGAWIDKDGNQVGKVDKQTTLETVKGGKNMATNTEKRSAS